MDKVKELVFELLESDNSGHGNDHIIRVYDLAIKFAKQEGADETIVGLAALLHDADDYKLFGIENAEKLTNAKNIMDKANIELKTQEKVLEIIRTMGYKRSLSGIRPVTLEGKIVSDADMCDAIGANGILRTYAYANAHNRPFFDKNVLPIEDMNNEKYNKEHTVHSVCHIFEKILKLKYLMLTKSGKTEIIEREKITIEFLRHIFKEEDAPEWMDYLENYLRKFNT